MNGEVRKTALMLLIEAQQGCDIREAIDRGHVELGELGAAAERLGTDRSTLSQWINGALRGGFVGVGIHRRLTFEGFELERERRQRQAGQDADVVPLAVVQR